MEASLYQNQTPRLLSGDGLAGEAVAVRRIVESFEVDLRSAIAF